MRSLRHLVITLFALVPGAAFAGIGDAVIVDNPYGPITVSGGMLSGNTITGFGEQVVIQLGPVPGAPGLAARIDFSGFDLPPFASLSVRSGAENQAVMLVNTSQTPTVIAGGVVAPFTLFEPAFLSLKSPGG